MKRWSDIIGYEPVEQETVVSGPTLNCCNCGNQVVVVNVWSKCEKCNLYNAKK